MSVVAAPGAAAAPSLSRVDVPRASLVFACAALSAAALLRFGLTGEGLVAAGALVVLAVLSSIDLRERRLPNAIVLPAAAVALVAQSAVMPDRVLEWVLSALLAFTVLFVAALINPRGIGMGDVKLALLLGAVLGSAVVHAFLIGFAAVLPVALVLFARHGAAARQATIPLGPFLAVGAAVVLMAGGPRDSETQLIVSPAEISTSAGHGR